MKFPENLFKVIVGILIVFTYVTCTPPVQASGLLLYETGTPGVGAGSAGYASSAQDASTVYYNPAGMMRLQKTESLLGIQVVGEFIDYKFGLLLGNRSGDLPSLWLPGASYYYVKDIDPRTKIGFGTFSNFGAAVKTGDNWPGRYVFQEGALIGLTLMPAIAHRMDDNWSIGAALNATYGILYSKSAINNSFFDRTFGDGKMEMNDKTWGFGGNIGLMYEMDKRTRFGLTYNSQVKLDFSTSPEFTNLGPVLAGILNSKGLLHRTIDLDVTIPQQVMLGFTRDMDSRWTLLGDVGWQNWANFASRQVTLDSANGIVRTSTINGKNTWHGALGAKYKASPEWTYSFGVGYDTSAFNDANHPSLLPVSGSWRYGLGVSKTISPVATLNFGYEMLVSGNVATDTGASMKAKLHFFTFNLQRKL